MEDSYIVRIYQRQEDQKTGQVAGIVEEVCGKRRSSFRNVTELWSILSGQVDDTSGRISSVANSTATILKLPKREITEVTQ